MVSALLFLRPATPQHTVHQVRTLLSAIRHGLCGERLVAFFGCLYFAGLRPEEAVSLRKHNLNLPSEGWGELHLTGAEPHAGKDWTDSGENSDRRQLKQRAVGEGRDVPCSPELTALLHEHVEKFGYASDGRVFTGERNKSELPKGTINRAWREARRATFTPEVCDSPLVNYKDRDGAPGRIRTCAPASGGR